MPIGFASASQSKLQLRIEVTDPQKDGDQWKLQVIAIVVDRDGPEEGKKIFFEHNGVKQENEEITDGEGRASMTFENLPKGRHTFVVQIAETAIRTKRVVDLKEEKTKRPAKIITRKIFNEALSQYQIFIQILTAEETPVSNTTVYILNGDKRIDLPKTDINGETTQAVNANSQKRESLKVCVAGSDLEAIINIFPRS